MNKFANKGAGLHDLILEFRKLSRSWDGKSKIPLGSVITKPSVAAIKAYEILLESNYNNIGFVDDPFNPKIKGTNLLAIEAKVLKMMNFLYHGNNCLGYITSGGTESNVMGLWLGREKFKDANKTLIIYSELTHYSVEKACDMLSLRNRKIITLDKNYGINVNELDKFIKKDRKYKNYLIVATLGYTKTGTIDDIHAISKIIKKHRKSGKAFYLHVDAAIGGFVLPFSNPSFKWDFSLREVDSISVDAHKMAAVPYPAGLFMARRHNYKKSRKIDYTGHVDATFLGSRPAVSAAAFYAVLMHFGFDGFKKTIKRCLDMKSYFLNRMNDTGICVIDREYMNSIAVSFPKLGKRGLSKAIEEKYSLSKTYLPSKKTGKIPFYTLHFMPHLNRDMLDIFINELLKIVR